jgi:hypothetical protein
MKKFQLALPLHTQGFRVKSDMDDKITMNFIGFARFIVSLPDD